MDPNKQKSMGPMVAMACSLVLGAVLAPRAWQESAMEPIQEPLQIATTSGTRELLTQARRSELTETPDAASFQPLALWQRELAQEALPDFSLRVAGGRTGGQRDTERDDHAARWEAIESRAVVGTLDAAPEVAWVHVDRPVSRAERDLWRQAEPPGAPTPSSLADPSSSAGPSSLARQSSNVDFNQQVWPVPHALLAQLEQLEAAHDVGPWVDRTREVLGQLAGQSLHAGEPVGERFAELEQCAATARRQAEQAGDSLSAQAIQRVRHAIERRLDVWQGLHDALTGGEWEATEVLQNSSVAADDSRAAALADVNRLLADAPAEASWRSYLLLDELERMTDERTVIDMGQRRELALQWLSRIQHARLTAEQRRFLSQPPIRRLADQLRPWATEPIDYAVLLEQVEQVEAGRDPAALRDLGRTIRLLQVASNRRLAALGRQLEIHYRNANLRLVVGESLIDELLPREIRNQERINARVAGNPVRGRGTATTRLDVELVPDDARWQLALQAEGQLISSTRSDVGPATFYNRARSDYSLRQILSVEPQGYSIRRVDRDARSFTRLAGLETDLDFIPLLGDLMQSIAERRYDRQLPQTRRALQRRVAADAADRLEREVRDRADALEHQFQNQLLAPLRKLQLTPATIEMRTVPGSLVGRYRISGGEQLAARTPRPREPEGSVLAFQLHQSALNNALERLDLAGRRCDLPTLFRELSAALGREDAEIPEEVRDEKAEIHFARQLPVRVDFDQQRLHVTLRLEELHADGQRPWRHLIVSTAYQPVADARVPRLERDGYIQLRGARLRLRDQIALRGIFSKMFPRHPRLNDALETCFAQSPLDGLEIGQFVLRDGWLGLSWKRPAHLAAPGATLAETNLSPNGRIDR